MKRRKVKDIFKIIQIKSQFNHLFIDILLLAFLIFSVLNSIPKLLYIRQFCDRVEPPFRYSILIQLIEFALPFLRIIWKDGLLSVL